MSGALLDCRQVEEYVSLRRTTIYKMIGEGSFPAPVRIGPRASRWRRAELDEWIAQLPRAEGME